jgi:hypothetical protein
MTELEKAFALLNESAFAKTKLKKHPSWLNKKRKGVASNGSFTIVEYKALATALRSTIADMEAAAQYCHKMAEDKTLLINIMTDEKDIQLL